MPNGCENQRRGTEHRDVGETKKESVYLSFSSPDSDREQTAEDNEKQIFGREEEEGGEKRRQRLGGGGEKKMKTKKKGEERGE